MNSYYRRILASIEAVPGVSHVCAMTYLPLESLHVRNAFHHCRQTRVCEPVAAP